VIPPQGCLAFLALRLQRIRWAARMRRICNGLPGSLVTVEDRVQVVQVGRLL